MRNTKKLFITVRHVKRIRKKVTKLVPYNAGVVRMDRDMGESCCFTVVMGCITMFRSMMYRKCDGGTSHSLSMQQALASRFV